MEQFHFSSLAVVVLLAALAAVALGKVKLQPFIGYVIAGLLVGPQMLGLINSQEQIAFIAELGVILLLFILGMELPVKDFSKSYKVALPVTLGLVGLSLAITFGIGLFIKLTLAQKIVYGFIISLSSTAVAVKLLEEVKLLDKGTGQVAVSVLIAQDLLFVPMIMVINAIGGGEDSSILLFLVKIAIAAMILVGLILFFARDKKVRLPFDTVVERYHDLIPVAALSLCLVGAGLSEWAGLSPAFGAFIVGLIIGNSASKTHIFHRIEPMQHVLLMVFFLSIGLLIDFSTIAANWILITALLLSTMVFKTIASIALLKFFLPQDRWKCSFVTGLTIAQIGEFSFILAAAALSNNIFDEKNYRIIIAVIALSLALSPLWSLLLRRFVEVTYRDKAQKLMTLTQGIKACLLKPEPIGRIQ